MATVFERPMSALSDTQAMPRQHSQQRRPSVVDVEIIDVDQIDLPSTSMLSRQRGQSSEVIVIDSDDESAPQHQASGSTRAGESRLSSVAVFTMANTHSSVYTASRRRRLISPPPPAVEPFQQPPVPPLPHRFAVLTGFPTNPRTLGTPPVIRPIERNFDLLGNTRPLSTTLVDAHPNRHRRPQIAEPRAERHHIGLGGAIIAINDQGPRLNNNHDRNRRYRHNHIADNEGQHGLIGRGVNALRRLYTTLARISPADDDDAFFPFEPLNAAAAAAADPGGFGFQDPFFHRRRPEEDKYKAEYTHPDSPQPGYTFNFAPPEPVPPKPAPIVIDLVGSDSEDGPIASSSKRSAPASPAASVRELLVCARCLDPLVLGGGLVGDEGRRRKVWALRCGHMIDGQCLDIVGVPEQVDGQEQRLDGKGKGKARAHDSAHALSSIEAFASAENTVRSRLRSRGPLPPVPDMLPASMATTTALGKRKRGTKPRIEATHEWKCPVESCGRVHASVKIDGVWGPEPDKGLTGGKGKWKKLQAPVEDVVPGRGAIAVFV
ncbi:hypothetical protein C0992_003920 [Termitomyces sp. T32_za158]|nr:hypothetical protein C0992_003920 [Termitomyces sp. T32_za158]